MRLNNMPILAFGTYYTDIEPEIMLTVLKDELCTSGFLPITSKNYVVFKVSTVNHNHIFNFPLKVAQLTAH